MLRLRLITKKNNFYYQGFRLTVMTYLPLTSNTIVYGSDNGGIDVFADIEVHHNMIEIAKRLNLRPHLVSKNMKPTALCGDIEIHKIPYPDVKVKERENLQHSEQLKEHGDFKCFSKAPLFIPL